MGVRLTDEQLEGKVVAGVDTHADTHWLCVLDERGRVAVSEEFAADAAGYAALADAIGPPDGCAAVGVEGTCSYGAQLADELGSRGFLVLEVLRPKRDKRMRGSGKDDAADAARAARDVLAGETTSIPKARGGWVDDLRSLLSARRRQVKSATETLLCARSLARTAPEAQRRRWEGMSGRALMRSLAALEGELSPLETSLRSLGRTWEACDEEAAALEARMREILEESCPALLAIHCCGAINAATLAVSAGENAARFGSEARFAKHCGVAPIPASSGKTVKMRLNPGGDRRANSALNEIAVCRTHHDPRTREYIRRRCTGEKPIGKRDAIRCLKRYIAREVYRALTHPHDVPPPDRSGQELREARLMASLTQAQVAAVLGISESCVSKIETGKTSRHSRFHEAYSSWVAAGLPMDVENSDGQDPVPAKKDKKVA